MTDRTQKTETAPQGTADPPQGTTTAPQGTATAPQGTATAPQGTATAPTDGGPAYSGSQADIVVQKGKVLKVYKPNCGYNSAVLPMVKRLKGKGVVVDLYDFGVMEYEGEQRQFELMEYCPEGAVSGVNLRGDKDAILAIVRKVAEALDACHREGFIHKDVKPANILIRNKKTWDCVLCDFGIADVLDHGKVVTGQARTPIYAAPEVYKRTIDLGKNTLCELTPAADFYSLGMTILCMWYGEFVFRSKEKQMAVTKVHDGIVVPTDLPEPLYTIARGLLVKDPAHRWGLKEINDYLNGAKVGVYNEQQKPGGLNIIYNSSKQQVAHSVEELAAFMAQDLPLAIRYLYSGKISKWLEYIPELQIEIENIVEQEYPKDQQNGVLAAIHLLNPFYDLHLCCDIHDAHYAMTGESIGKVLNEAYDHYFTRGDAGTIDLAIAQSFSNGNAKDYVPWFLDHKGQRFAQQRKWFDYCVKGDAQNAKKAGPKDSNYLHQVAMMKTIAGFGATPEFRLSRTGEVLRSVKDVYRVSKKDLQYDLEHDNGLRGWLAVLCHENPHADLKKKYNYEKLLKQYVDLIGYIDPEDKAYKRFCQAQDNANDILAQAKGDAIQTSILLQKLISVVFGFIPLTILLIKIILNIWDHPVVRIGNWIDSVTGVIGLIAAIIAFFSNRNDGCIVPIIIGVVVAVIAAIVLNILGFIILYLYAIAVIAAIIYFGIVILYDVKSRRSKQHITSAGFEELTLEPLYFAFSNETKFDSSLNGAADIQSAFKRKETIKKKWGMVLIFLGVTLVLVLCRLALPKSERMDRFDEKLKHPFRTEIKNDEEVQPLSDSEP